MNMNKEHILQEIRRTAKTNGGTPLGKVRFSKETGIKEHDWAGKYWARWNNAIREADLEPNELVGKIDENLLFEKYAGLARRFGRLPVIHEINLESKMDKAFPKADTYYRGRFGSKLEFLNRLVEWSNKKGGYEDIVAFCERLNEQNQNEETPSKKTNGETHGFVYLLKSGRFYKVGRSIDAGRRQYELGIQLPEKPKEVHLIRTDDPVGIEAYWHKRFEGKRKNGEWFELSSEDISAFKRRKFM